MSDVSLYALHAAFDNATIIVTNSAELNNAITTLSAADGGTILMDGSVDEAFYMNVKNMSADSPDILIKPLDDDLPPDVTQVNIIGGAHLTVTGLNINSDDIADERSSWYNDVNILSSTDITFVGNTMTGKASGFLNGDPDDVIGQRAVMIRDSQDIAFNNNTVTDYYNGITYLEVQGLEISGNDISGIQGDGMRGGGIQDVRITDNYLHDFHGSMQSFNHTDMIQIWGTNASITRNVEISGNVLDAGDGAATQSILIQNEDFTETGYFDTIVIQDNIIHNGMAQGIGVNHITNLTVSDNTVLWNPNAETQVSATASMNSTYPRIILRDAPDAEVTGNITGPSLVNEAELAGDNAILSFTDPDDPMYAKTHFVNLTEHGDLGLMDLALRPDSALLNAYGALASSTPYLVNDAAAATLPPVELAPVMSMSDLYGSKAGVELSAEYSLIDGAPIDPDTATVRWIFGDGTQQTGLTARHIYDTPGLHDITLEITTAQGQVSTTTRMFETEDPHLVELDFTDGVTDLSAFASDIDIDDPEGDGFVAGRDGGAFELTGADNIQVDRFNSQLAGLDTFKLDIGFAMSDTESTGLLAMKHETLTVDIIDKGYLSFVVGTNDGYFKVVSDEPALTDTDWHDLSFVFDGPAGTMHIEMDGEIIGSGAASGSTSSSLGYDLVVGSEWRPTVEGRVDHFALSSPTSSLYEDEDLTGTPVGTTDDTVTDAGGAVDGATMLTGMTQTFMTMFNMQDSTADGTMSAFEPASPAATDTSDDSWATNLFDILTQTGWHSDAMPVEEDATLILDDALL